MRNHKITLFASFLIFFSVSLAQAASQEDFTPVAAAKNFYVDPYSGSANFSIPISMPKALGRLPQKLNLVYSSRASNGWLGAGWKLDLAVIERSTKNGYPKYDATDKFNFSLGEQQEELVSTGSSTYRAKTAGVAWQFVFDGQRWTVKDNTGTTYYFGLDNSLNDLSRTTDGAGRVFRWRLSKIADTSGNNIIFKYSADKIEIYYSEKSESAKSSFKSRDYNYLVSIDFSADRKDKVTSYRPGFTDNYPLDGAGRVSAIRVLYRDKLVRRYVPEYKYSAVTGRSLLTKISEFGSDGLTANPPVTFNYSTSDFKYVTALHSKSNEYWKTPWRIRFADNINQPIDNFKLTADGLVSDSGLFTPISWSSAYNTESGSEAGFSWSVKPSASEDTFHRKIGNLHIGGKKGQAFHAWTYIALQIWENGYREYIVQNSNNCNAVYYLSDGKSIKGPYLLNQPVSFGNLANGEDYIFRFDIVGYNFSQNFNLDFNIAENFSFWESLKSTGELPTPRFSGDFNGDGVTDLSSGTNVALSNKRDFKLSDDWSNNGSVSSFSNILGDFNGDGMTDVCHNFGGLKVALSEGTKFVDKGTWLQTYATPSTYGDFNGDGMTDVCYLTTGGSDMYCRAAFSDGKSFQSQNQFKFNNYAYESSDNFFTGDFNGDGVTDFAVWKKNKKTLLVMGYNNAWSSSIVIDDPKALSSDYRLDFGQDFNFDGKADLFLYNIKEPSFYVMNLFGPQEKTRNSRWSCR